MGRSRNDSFGGSGVRSQTDAKLNAVGGVGMGGAGGWSCAVLAGGVAAGDRIRANTKNLAAEKQARDAFKTPAKTLAAAGGSTNRSVGALVRARCATETARSSPSAFESRRTAPRRHPRRRTCAATAPSGQAGKFIPVRRCSPSDGGPAPSSARGCFTAPRRSNPRPGRRAARHSGSDHPAWVALPARDAAADRADRAQQRITDRLQGIALTPAAAMRVLPKAFENCRRRPAALVERTKRYACPCWRNDHRSDGGTGDPKSTQRRGWAGR